mmetsp:Transcript_73108/g.136653  ORF Transcript_73108/g.136653 Transcript_73108/m.136653 type:complete len:168 (-) Transcript_73108:90-593(-)
MFDKFKKGINDITTQAQERVNVAKDAKAMLDKPETAEIVQVKKAAEDAVNADAKALMVIGQLAALYEAAESRMSASSEQEFKPLNPAYKERGAKIKEALQLLQSTQPPPLPAISLAEKDAIQVLRAKGAVGMQHRPSTGGSAAGSANPPPTAVQGEAVPPDANAKRF